LELAIEDLENGVSRVALRGRLDTAGANEIDPGFRTIAGNRRGVVVDLAGVSYLASLGLHVLLLCAKSLARNGGKMVLLSPTANVEDVIRSSGTDLLIPIYHDVAAALAAVKL